MSATIDITAPAEQTEGTRSQLLRWLKSVGEPVTQNEPLIEIETDKVTVEVAAPASGVLSQILKREQEEITPGELLGRILTAPPTAQPPAPASQTVLPGAASTARPPMPESTAPGAGAAPLSPAVRRLLAERDLTAAQVRGSGQGGRITVEDVLQAAPSNGAVPARTSATVAAGSEKEPGTGGRRVPHSPIRKRIAQHMVQSLLHTAPHVTTVFEADLSAVLAHRARHREAFAQQGVALTLTAYFVQASVTAIRAVPEANSRWGENELEIFDAVHVGMATAVEGTGLVVPVLHDAQRLDLLGTARALQDLTGRARAGKLTPTDVRGGTFTISNHGVSGSLMAAPIIINQPQSAILGVGKLERRPVVIGPQDAAQIVVRPRCYITLTLDHRVMDGHQANHFLSTMIERLQAWPLEGA